MVLERFEDLHNRVVVKGKWELVMLDITNGVLVQLDGSTKVESALTTREAMTTTGVLLQTVAGSNLSEPPTVRSYESF